MSIINNIFDEDDYGRQRRSRSVMIIGNNHRHNRRSHSQTRPSSLMFQNYHPSLMMNENDEQSTINNNDNRILETQLDQDVDENYDDYYNYPNEINQQSSMMNNEQQQYYAENESECSPIEHQESSLVDDPIVDNQMMLMYPSSDDDYHNEYLMQQQQEVGIYGWRKKILYILLAINIIMVGINFGLAFWIISVLGFSTNGIGPLDFGSNDDQIIRIHGSVLFEKLLFARRIRSWPNDEFRMTTKNGDIIFRSISNDSSSTNENRLIISNDKITLFTDHFEVYDRKNTLMLALDSINDETSNQNESQITIRSNAIKFLNENNNNLNLPLSLQTPTVINTINDELRLYSPQSRLLLRGPQSVHLESKLGDVSIVTYDDLRLQSNDGRITVDSRAIYMRNLWTTTLKENQTLNTDESTSLLSFTKPIVYQVCVCAKSGRLFLAHTDEQCQVKSYRDCR